METRWVDLENGVLNISEIFETVIATKSHRKIIPSNSMKIRRRQDPK